MAIRRAARDHLGWENKLIEQSAQLGQVSAQISTKQIKHLAIFLERGEQITKLPTSYNIRMYWNNSSQKFTWFFRSERLELSWFRNYAFIFGRLRRAQERFALLVAQMVLKVCLRFLALRAAAAHLPTVRRLSALKPVSTNEGNLLCLF